MGTFFCLLEKSIKDLLSDITENKYGLCVSGRELVMTCFLREILYVGFFFGR